MDRRGGRAPARQGFDRFVADTTDGLLRSAYLITWDLTDAEDLVQDCLFKVARRWPRVRNMEHPAAYARTVLVHLALDDGKRRSRRRAELQPDTAGVLEGRDDEAAVHVLGRVEVKADLLLALGALPPRQRAALVLRYFDDMSEVEVAAVMGCSVGTVKSTTSRALDRLRGVVDRPGAEAVDASEPAVEHMAAAGTTRTITEASERAAEGSITR